MGSAYEIPGFSFSLNAAADLSATQFRFVDVNASGKAAAITTAGAKVIGVRQNKPKADEPTTIVVNGVSIVEAGAAITSGDLVSTDNVGRAKTAVATERIHGVALKSAAAAGEKIAVLLYSAPNVA